MYKLSLFQESRDAYAFKKPLNGIHHINKNKRKPHDLLHKFRKKFTKFDSDFLRVRVCMYSGVGVRMYVWIRAHAGAHVYGG